jgi:hypothetical protein
METPILKRSSTKSNNFLDVGFKNHIEQKTGGLNPNVRAVSACANFNASDIEALKVNHATGDDVNKVKTLLPMRLLMQNALKRKGYPVPSDILALTNSFYNNIVKKTEQGKHFEHAEGNPILYKLHADSNVIAATIDIIPAATNFINYAVSNNNPQLDAQLINDALDIRDYINAKRMALATDNFPVSSFSINPWFVGGIILVIILLFRK